MGLYTPTILGGNSYLSWFYDRGAIKGPPHTGTSEGLSQAINRRPIRNILPNYANVYVTIQSHGLSAGVQTHYVTAYGVRNGLMSLWLPTNKHPVPEWRLRIICYSASAGVPLIVLISDKGACHNPRKITLMLSEIN